mmetsp:Transcript_48416/g.97415  ORF Transcript_48416/g.97415 Transcript_48416/m.97415 type:complete len:195 (-) Transcript_48416:51-635(-)
MKILFAMIILTSTAEGFHRDVLSQIPRRRVIASDAVKGGRQRKLVAVNKQARRSYEIIETVEAGIQLLGTETKAVRTGGLNIQDGYAQVKNGECWMKNVHIGPHPSTGTFFQHEAKRERKLLLHKKEIRKFEEAIKKSQMTLVPLSAYFNEDGRLKVSLGLGKGKNQRDKRFDIEKREVGRELQRAVKNLRGPV